MSGHAESVRWLNGVWVWEQDGDTPQTDPTHWIPKPPVPPNTRIKPTSEASSA
jgi:hypothetical protein